MRVAVIAFVLAFTATAVRADDDPLAEAMRLEGQLEYEPALAIIERTIAQGTADHDRLVTLHLFAGKLAAGLDRPAVAEDHFARVLALAPTTTFAEGTSPKITEPFDRARGHTSQLRITTRVAADAITIEPAADPLGLVAGVAVTLEGGREIRETQHLRIALPAGAHAIKVFALDVFGNRVWSEPITTTTPQLDQPRRLRPLYARWTFWASTTVVALGAAGVSAWRFDVTQDEWNRRKADGMTSFSTLQSIEARGKRWALAANISFAAAGATTLLAIITGVRGSYTTPVVQAQEGRIGLAVAGRF
ncbi:MAG TPA: hypothetical protein VIV40_06260 [Kofleriaceae bacterium]